MIDAAGLRVMRAIAEEGSFTAAAASLGYSQPAISQMVRRLEERTGTVLVERIGRSVRLTEAGEVLARHAVPVLTALDRAEGEIRAIAGLQSGRVRLTAFPSAASTLVPQALALVKQRFPDVRVAFTEAEPPEALASLRAGDCDVAVTFVYDGDTLPRGEDDLDPFSVQTLLEDEVRIVLPATTRWPRRSASTSPTSTSRPGSPAARAVAVTCSRSRSSRASSPRWPSRPRTTSRCSRSWPRAWEWRSCPS
ncbi:hypothetical protein GCM10025872_12070 [Barrientosiimonas endolithica]|uniref:HTH lysR-type domain-containing protein n=1 Tax=Barrientosiimonas endolithica TaxID=1535208 RepID=A0ABN6YJG5_9MICO|nr:hypothetical protein GCM10025872_12070 [Barrientosiimonas endolithica]